MNGNDTLTRRDLIRQVLLLAGATTIATSPALLSGCAMNQPRADAASATEFSATDILWLDEVAETILPATKTPGAKAAEVGGFIALMVTDTNSPAEQAEFRRGMQALETECVKAHGSGFLEATPAERLDLLERLDRERLEATDQGDHYFSRIKELTVIGYFTSEIGYTQALQYVETPGRYDPCVSYEVGEPMWARHR